MKHTTKELTYIHKASSGQFTLDKGQPIGKYDSKLVIPIGTATNHMTASGIDTDYNFVVDNAFADRYYHHDMEYSGINIPKEYVGE